MVRVGLTGGIGSGKSTVAGVLRELGAVVTDADRVAREVVEPGAPALRAIRERFGEKVIQPDGRLDRAGLAAVVFPDPAALRALEAITGPAIADRVSQLRAAVPAHRVDVYDMPLLVEKGLWVHEHLTLCLLYTSSCVSETGATSTSVVSRSPPTPATGVCRSLASSPSASSSRPWRRSTPSCPGPSRSRSTPPILGRSSPVGNSSRGSSRRSTTPGWRIVLCCTPSTGRCSSSEASLSLIHI